MENTMNVKEATNAHDEHQNGLAVPEAKRVPKERTFHGDTFIDNYEWLRDKESQDVRDYVAAENRYCEQRMAPLVSLRKTLFDEFKSHVQETDMSVPTRMDGYWYFTRTKQGEQYAVQCRVPIRGADDWDPPTVEAGVPLDGEQVVFDTNVEAEGHDFFRIGGMDISKDGRWMLYGTDTSGDERYDFRIRDLETGDELEERFEGIGGACFTPDAQWVFYVLLDDAWRPYAVMRHRVGTPVTDDVEVYREADERFWAGIGLSFDERNIVIGTGSKTTTEVLMLPVDTPEGSFRAFIPRETDVEYDVSFACFEGAGEHGEDIPLAVVYHNALNPNFEIDVIDMRTHEPPYRLGEGVRVAVGSPYGCEHGDDVDPGASSMPIGTPYSNPCNPAILQGAHGLGIEGISIHRHFVALQYRAESLPHIAVMTKRAAAEDFLAGRPWRFTELVPHALEDDWDVDESVDEINEERAEIWGKLDAAAAEIRIQRVVVHPASGISSPCSPRLRSRRSSHRIPRHFARNERPERALWGVHRSIQHLGGGFDPVPITMFRSSKDSPMLAEAFIRLAVDLHVIATGVADTVAHHRVRTPCAVRQRRNTHCASGVGNPAPPMPSNRSSNSSPVSRSRMRNPYRSSPLVSVPYSISHP